MIRHRRLRGRMRRESHNPDKNAFDDLRFIRATMEQSVRFTDVPGRGMVVMGATAIAAAVLASRESGSAWALTWEVEAIIALAVGMAATVLKAQANGTNLLAGPARKFHLGLLPPLIAGGLLTIVLQADGQTSVLPGLWLLLYGAAIITAGAHSVRVVPAMGLSFMMLGGVALVLPASFDDIVLAAGFGGLHLGYGLVVAGRYGG